MILLLVVGPRLLPEPPRGAARLDLPGAALSLAAVLAVIYGLKQLVANGDTYVSVLVIAAGLVLAFLFARRQRRPGAARRTLAVPIAVYSAALATNFLAFFVVFGMSLFLAQYLQSVLGLLAARRRPLEPA